MASLDPLSVPFGTWQEGLLMLAAALGDLDREKIIVSRLEATAAKNGISLTEILALALVVPSRARFEPSSLPQWEPDPNAVAMGEKLGQDSKFNRYMSEMLDAHEARQKKREERVFSAFAETDPRRIFISTIFGLAAAELADVSQRLGEADPFARLARRLSLWFKPYHDHSRYGISLPWSGSEVAAAVLRLVDRLGDHCAARTRQLIDIWAGGLAVVASDEGINAVAALCDRPETMQDVDELDCLLALEIYSALADDLEKFDEEMLEAYSKVLKWLPKRLEDGRPSTSDIPTWLESWSNGGERYRLVFDPSHAFSSAMYNEHHGYVLEPLMRATIETMAKKGHALFATGPFQIRGAIFNRDTTMFQALADAAPEVADLYRLTSTDGDYSDLHGPFNAECYWTGELDPQALTIPEAIDRARERGDHALCDILIGSWLLFCPLFQRNRLPDIAGLARHINALPVDHRSSTYSVIGVLKRDAVGNPRLRRDLDALLSWLPLVDIAPPEDFEAYLRDLFSPALWNSLDEQERKHLCEGEEVFVRARRLGRNERERERFRFLIVDWSAVSEGVSRRLLDSLEPSTTSRSRKPLGELVGEMHVVLRRVGGKSSGEHRDRIYLALDATRVLDRLNMINRQGGKHLGGSIIWEDVAHVHAGLYWALRGLLGATDSQTTKVHH